MKTVYINYFDKIDAARVNALMNALTQILAQHNPDVLYFLFSSPGGEVHAGITLYNFLRALPPRVVMHNTGSVDSIATVVFLAGDDRYASPNSTFLFHGVKAGFAQGAQLSLSQVTEIKSSLTEDQNKISGIIASRTNTTAEQVGEFFNQGESKNVEFALSSGFVSDVKDPAIPPGEIFFNVSFGQN